MNEKNIIEKLAIASPLSILIMARMFCRKIFEKIGDSFPFINNDNDEKTFKSASSFGIRLKAQG